MPLYVCIDGGGSKTTAVIAHVEEGSPSFVRGEAGPSNLTQNGPEVCIAALTLATTSALAQIPTAPPCPSVTSVPVFARVWAGIAGCARPPDYALLRPLLEALFKGSEVRLTGDGELLTAPIYATPHLDLITLICGTGSLALRWHRDSQLERVTQVAREGGWGFLLGDEGSGWSLGREGIKSVLTYTANRRPLLPWHAEILERFGVVDEPHRLLAALTTLESGVPISVADSERKKRIAACTKHVVQAAQRGDQEAMKSLRKVAGELVGVLRPLVELEEDLKGTVLSVGGGLAGVESFWEEVERGMAEQGWDWGMVTKVQDAAMEGVKVIMDDASWLGP